MPGVPAKPAGFEIQIDNTASPDGRLKHRTGAVYAVNYPNDLPHDPQVPPPVAGDFVNPQNAQVLGWNQYRIEVRGDVITVNLNGVDTAKYTNTDGARGRFSATEPTFVGLQSYSNYGLTTALRRNRAPVLLVITSPRNNCDGNSLAVAARLVEKNHYRQCDRPERISA